MEETYERWVWEVPKIMWIRPHLLTYFLLLGLAPGLEWVRVEIPLASVCVHLVQCLASKSVFEQGPGLLRGGVRLKLTHRIALSVSGVCILTEENSQGAFHTTKNDESNILQKDAKSCVSDFLTCI